MGSIKGRADDMLIIRGVNLFHTQIEAVLEGIEELAPQYQLIVENNGKMDTVLVKVEKEDTFQKSYNTLSPARQSEIDLTLEKKLVNKIKDNVGLSMKVSIINCGDIPRSAGGKLSRIKDLR